jgi:bifunctional non-homologous end joining protein LigD
MRRSKFPSWVEPMAATLTQERFASGDWSFERKHDGIRLIAYKRGTDVRLFSRTRTPQDLPLIARAIRSLPVREAILDGEITWDGRTYYVFDVLRINGHDVTRLTLTQRRELLKVLPLRKPLIRVRELRGSKPWERACAKGWEGVIAKRRDSPYEHRRSKYWLKMKCEQVRDFVIGGFTDPQGGRVGLGALLVGYFDGDDFAYAGKVGTGFDTQLLTSLRKRLDAIEVKKPPFTKGTGLPRIRAHWVRPTIVVQVAFTEWTVHTKLRHPRLLGMQRGIRASDVAASDR